jgi:hypothetical protein
MPEWTRGDAEQAYFIYVEQEPPNDLLDPLLTDSINDAELRSLLATLRANLRATALAASTPFYLALFGAFDGRTEAIQKLIDDAAKSGNRERLLSAIALLQEPAAPIERMFERLRVLHERGIGSDMFQALLRQATALAWGAFETYCLDALLLVFARNAKFLGAIVAKQGKNDPWNTQIKQLSRWVTDEQARDPSLSLQAALRSFPHVLQINLRAVRHLFGVLFATDTTLGTALSDHTLEIASARRHLLMHRAGVVDDEYLAKTGERVPVGSSLAVVPKDVADSMKAIAVAAAALATVIDRSL